MLVRVRSAAPFELAASCVPSAFSAVSVVPFRFLRLGDAGSKLLCIGLLFGAGVGGVSVPLFGIAGAIPPTG